jgi:hypothetical protein
LKIFGGLKDMGDKVKKPIFKRWWFWVLAIIVIFAFSNGGDDSAETTSTESTETKAADKKEEKKAFGLNQEVAVGKFAYTVKSVEEQKELKMEYMDTLKTDGKFVIIEVVVKNGDKEARMIDGEMFRLVEGDGTEYETTTDADMYINNGDIGFFLQEVNPKMSKTGKIAFEVPAEATDLQLQVSSGLGWSGGDYQVINLK